MGTGNRAAVILCNLPDSRMFPFVREEGNSILPVGNQTLLERNIDILKKQGIQDIYVLGKQSAVLRRAAGRHCCVFSEMRGDIFRQAAEVAGTREILLMDGNIYVEEEDIRLLSEQMGQTYGVVLGRPWKDQESGFGTALEDGKAPIIYGHPRDHYVDTRVFGVCTVPAGWVSKLADTVKGGGTINCGQMPDAQYHLESALDQLIRQGLEIRVQICLRPIISVCFPWDIFEANICCCRTLEEMKQDCIGGNSLIENVRRGGGYIQVGENCRIHDVSFEGNCVIGDNVVLENGAVIGNNCIIGSGSIIRHSCLIHEDTVIGPANKVDFGAEISGVTMEGTAAVHGCEVFGVIGRHVDIAAGVVMGVLRFDDAWVPRKVNGRVYRSPYTNCICIGDYTRTGVHTTFLPGVSVGSRCAVGPGVLVDKDVNDNTLLLLRQETVEKEWGSLRYGWQENN